MIKNGYQIFGISWFRKSYCVLRFTSISILYTTFTVLYSYLILMLLIGIIHLFSNLFFLTFIQILSKSLFTHPCHSNACLSGYGLGYNGQPCRLWSYAFLHKYCILLFPFFSVYLMCKKTLRISCSSYSDVYRTHCTPETC